MRSAAAATGVEEPRRPPVTMAATCCRSPHPPSSPPTSAISSDSSPSSPSPPSSPLPATPSSSTATTREGHARPSATPTPPTISMTASLVQSTGSALVGSWSSASLGIKGSGLRAWKMDGSILRLRNLLVDCVERRVCEARAEFLCQETGIVWFYVSDILKLMEELKTKENLALDDKTFSLVKQEALRNIEGSLETRIDSNGIKEFMCPDQLVVLHKPFCCSVKHWIYGHVLPISIISVLLAAGVASSLKIMKAKQLNGRAEQLYQQVIEILEEHATMHEISDPSNVKIQPCVVYSWLRDHLLSTKERKQPVLWKKVEELIQQDSRIDQYPKLIKGESRIVLEWQVKGSLSAKMKKRAKEAAGKVESRDLNHSGPEDRRHAEPLQSY